MSDIDSDKWLEVMKSKMDSIDSNQVWTLVDPPKGIKTYIGGFHFLLEKNRRSVISKGPSMASNKLLEAGNTFGEVVRGYGFIKNEHDPCVYKKVNGSSVVYVVLYIDDILLIGNDVKMLGDNNE
ncbi:hypothetical protein Sango_2938200 [Sesamum angolense]|uniref:Reverse transcriptase Ty1/copia-type domain-containing protein n=1 Tax=Sesamum angolense TaxID=2727404 RepID=A0AAE1T4M3_9LAMI|nr:hypothetical protein Sango_2938200 [Sesamum angolense]